MLAQHTGELRCTSVRLATTPVLLLWDVGVAYSSAAPWPGVIGSVTLGHFSGHCGPGSATLRCEPAPGGVAVRVRGDEGKRLLEERGELIG